MAALQGHEEEEEEERSREVRDMPEKCGKIILGAVEKRINEKGIGGEHWRAEHQL